jgi:cytokinin dehydrogenase
MEFEKLKQKFKGSLVFDPDILNSLSLDFGKMVRKVPEMIAVPSNSTDVELLLEWANWEGKTVTIRGSGHSQSGQSLSEGGILLDLVNLNRILKKEKQSVWVEAGRTWGSLIWELASRSLIPPVLTNNLEATVGGTLSIGGLGSASHRYGLQADNIEAFEVITGSGELVQCSRDQNADFFDVVRCGLGQFGVITKVKLRLRKALSKVRTYFLLYDDLSSVMEDLEKIISDNRFDFIEGWCTPCMQGLRKLGDAKVPFAEWLFPIHVSVEYEGSPPPDSRLSGLKYYRLVHIEDDSVVEYLSRTEDLFQLWRETGSWKLNHPGMDIILPWDRAYEYIQGVLKSLPPDLVAGGQILLWPCRKMPQPSPLFMYPNGNLFAVLGILPAVSRSSLGMTVSLMDKASDLGIQIGGKRYLSGWVRFNHQEWRRHFGAKWEEIVQVKMMCDPNGVLNPGFIQFRNES